MQQSVFCVAAKEKQEGCIGLRNSLSTFCVCLPDERQTKEMHRSITMEMESFVCLLIADVK